MMATSPSLARLEVARFSSPPKGQRQIAQGNALGNDNM